MAKVYCDGPSVLMKETLERSGLFKAIYERKLERKKKQKTSGSYTIGTYLARNFLTHYFNIFFLTRKRPKI